MAIIKINNDYVAQLISLEYGLENGVEELLPADDPTPDGRIYFKIIAKENSVIDYTDEVSDTAYTNVTINAGVELKGQFDQINVDSGSIAVYQGEIQIK